MHTETGCRNLNFQAKSDFSDLVKVQKSLAYYSHVY